MTIALDRVAVRLSGRPILAEVAATLAGGSLVGIIGPNGAGKSSLVRAMLGLVPLAGGAVRIDDRAVPRWPRRDLARRLAYLPQGQSLHWPLSVERLVALGRLPHLGPLSRPAAADAAAIERALARAGVAALRDRVATELSGGERARVLLARALAVAAPALIVDEPLAALDPGHQLDVMALLRAEADGGALVVAVLHDLTMAARFCDRLLLLDRGRLVADAAPAALLAGDALARAYGVDLALLAGPAGPVIVPLARGDRPAAPLPSPPNSL